MKKTHLLAAAGSAAALASMLYRQRALPSLSGKTVLITGGSRGLGLLLAREFGMRGASLILVARKNEELLEAREHLVRGGLSADLIQAYVCDITDAAQTAALATLGAIDILVNNAGIITVGPADTFTLADYTASMQTNFFGALHTTLAILPQMLGRGAGTIVNIGSIGGKIAVPHLLPYVASKFAMVGWSTGLRTELRPYGIRVTTVNPGVMATGSHVQAFFKGNAEAEYKWFSVAATLPFTSVRACHAARRIVEAALRGTPEITIGLHALLPARLSNLFPSATAAALLLANALLPENPAASGDRAVEPVQGSRLQGVLPAPVERLSNRNIERFHQDSSTQQ